MHDVVPTPSYVSLTSSKLTTNSIQITGSDVRLTCVVELHPAILDYEIFLLMVDTQLSRNGTPLPLAGPTVTSTTFTYTTQLDSFQRSDFGNYTCTAIVRPQSSSAYLTGIDVLSNTLNIKPSKHCMTLIINLALGINYSVLAFLVILPPVDVRATQSSPSAPVEVSWSSPTEGDIDITGYRIFYGSGENVSVPILSSHLLV